MLAPVAISHGRIYVNARALPDAAISYQIIKHKKKRTVAVNRQSSLLKHTYEINFLLIELTLGWA